MKVLVTDTARNIGWHVAMRLLERGDDGIGIDNLSNSCDAGLKKARLVLLSGQSNYTHTHADLAYRARTEKVFATKSPQRVIDSAAQAGVEQPLGRQLEMELLPLQAGDVPKTSADFVQLVELMVAPPQTHVDMGVKTLAEWCLSYYFPKR